MHLFYLWTMCIHPLPEYCLEIEWNKMFGFGKTIECNIANLFRLFLCLPTLINWSIVSHWATANELGFGWNNDWFIWHVNFTSSIIWFTFDVCIGYETEPFMNHIRKSRIQKIGCVFFPRWTNKTSHNFWLTKGRQALSDWNAEFSIIFSYIWHDAFGIFVIQSLYCAKVAIQSIICLWYMHLFFSLKVYRIRPNWNHFGV